MSRPVLSDWEPYMIEVLHRKGDDRRVDQHGAQEAAQEGGRMSDRRIDRFAPMAATTCGTCAHLTRSPILAEVGVCGADWSDPVEAISAEEAAGRIAHEDGGAGCGCWEEAQ